jgi:hypothetical protein
MVITHLLIPELGDPKRIMDSVNAASVAGDRTSRYSVEVVLISSCRGNATEWGTD